MALKANQDTYAFVDVYDALGNATELRRQVAAGATIPDNWRPADEGAFEETDTSRQAPGYKREQLEGAQKMIEDRKTGAKVRSGGSKTASGAGSKDISSEGGVGSQDAE